VIGVQPDAVPAECDAKAERDVRWLQARIVKAVESFLCCPGLGVST